MAKRRKNKLAALTTKQKVLVAGVSFPVVLAIGFGAFVLYRIFKASRATSEEIDQPEQQNVEVVTSNDPKCQNLETKLSTPSGCGSVKVLAYRADTKDRTSFMREQVTIGELPGFPGYYLQRSPVDAWAAFQRLYEAAKAAKINLQVNSAFRTMAKQEELYNKYITGRGNLAARPGRSTHQYGVTVDIQVKGQPATLNWLRANAGKFGFFETVASEPWHWEYIKSRDPVLNVA